MRVVLPSPPSANAYWRSVGARVLKSAAARKYVARAALCCIAARVKPLAGDVAVRVKWYRPAKRGDLDNHLKVALDALQGLCYMNDGQITRLMAERYEDAENPRLEVEVTAA